MICPKCKKSDTKVVDSRDVNDCTRRRRECLDCNFRFTTYERTEPINIIVIKKNFTKEPYQRNKIHKGILIACKNRPIDKEQIENVVDKIECILMEKGENHISSKTIGKMVLEELKQIDKVAYLRFASVHKNFANPERFNKELKKIKE